MPQQRTMVTRLCARCQSPFEGRLSDVQSGRRRFCGVPCARRGEMSAVDRFFSYVAKTDGCWPWMGARTPRGYGRPTVDGVSRKATHWAWEIASGEPIPQGLWVLHTCDNPPCVRNDTQGVYVINGISRPRYGHLWLGTHQDNMTDRLMKGRYGVQVRLKGEAVASAKLTAANVEEIRQRYAAGSTSQKSLAAEFNVDNSHISRIISRRYWK